MKVFHRTSHAAADAIREQKSFLSRERGAVFVSNRVRGQALGFGPAVVRLNIPASALQLDDEFPGGERHFRIEAASIRPEWIEG